ncbi:unnamed protein product [Linum trigynum]|uniref:Uncharacterized protein n=1 Tax=Linum trigynum TaxID=586398 RepID=A0AAV2DEB7_9ROSI
MNKFQHRNYLVDVRIGHRRPGDVVQQNSSLVGLQLGQGGFAWPARSFPFFSVLEQRSSRGGGGDGRS